MSDPSVSLTFAASVSYPGENSGQPQASATNNGFALNPTKTPISSLYYQEGEDLLRVMISEIINVNAEGFSEKLRQL